MFIADCRGNRIRPKVRIKKSREIPSVSTFQVNSQASSPRYMAGKAMLLFHNLHLHFV